MSFKKSSKMVVLKKLLVLSFIQNLHSTVAKHVYPKLTFEDAKVFRKFFLQSTNQLVYYNASVFKIPSVRCDASFLTEWNVTGFISSPVLVSVFVAFGRNRVLVDAKSDEVVFSLRVTCQMVGNPNVENEIYLFHVDFKSKHLVKDYTINVTDSRVIPCTIIDPTQDVELYLMTDHGEEVIVKDFDKSLSYVLTEGFVSDLVFDGEYNCKQGSSSMIIKAFTTNSSDNFKFNPTVDSIKAFSGSAIQVECITNSTIPLEIVIDVNDLEGRNLTQSYKVSADNYEPYVTAVYGIQNDKAFATMVGYVGGDWCRLSGTAHCVTNLTASDTPTVLKSWTYEFQKSPELIFDNFKQKMRCRSYGKRTEFNTFGCLDAMDCSFKLLHCARGLATCQEDSQVFESAGINNTGLCQGDLQLELPISYVIGLATCSSDEVIKQWIFFEALDRKIYTNWEDLSPTRFIRMNEAPSILYTNTSSQFVCEAVTFLFVELSFMIEFENESNALLKNDYDQVNIQTADEDFPGLIWGLNVMKILDIYLPWETVGIRCVGLLWNSTETLNATQRFQMKHLVKPTFYGITETPYMKQNFVTNKKDQRLICPVFGEPQPLYSWYFNNKSVSNIFPELRIYLGSNLESFLEFPILNATGRKIYSGVYKCVAENYLGGVEQTYHLNIFDPPASQISTLNIILIIVGSILLVVMFGTALVFILKYKRSKQQLRNLTQTEVDEFYDGRPDLVGNGNNADTAEFLPFKKDYEIPFSDLEFCNKLAHQTYFLPSNDKNLLGSGEFAVVVRGLVIPRAKPVALKISKPSTDVTSFKSFLSEVKIMSYIGEHRHVVALIGVCTENIKCRSIYIATEICGLGSLIQLLIKSRSSFINFVNANQQIDVSVQPQISTRQPQLTTLDLISFSAQIATGMEYLSYKSVIHADLAARNVLITDSNVVKISDFGLSKRLYENTNYVKKSKTPLPWRWMALESLQTLTFSTKSDVWSYGVTLFEIFTLGDIPFPNEHWSAEFMTRLEDGLRMGRPKYSTQEIYSKIVACWENDPEHRPDFGTWREYFETLYKAYSHSETNEITFTQEVGSTTQRYSHKVTGDKHESCKSLENITGNENETTPQYLKIYEKEQ